MDLLLVPMGPLPAGLLEVLAQRAGLFGLRAVAERGSLDPAFAYDPGREQYLAAALLDRLADLPGGRVLGVTGHDLFNPVLTFVFGEAQMPGRAAVFSVHRLREEFYGLPPNPGLLRKRAMKEALHELGHTFGLAHCRDASCVMSSSHSVEGVDGQGEGLCRWCGRGLAAAVQRGATKQVG
jgi:archaemetzincin